jgi:hypothetical protein
MRDTGRGKIRGDFDGTDQPKVGGTDDRSADLERLARIARGLPGRTVAAAWSEDEGEDDARISVDGIDADELILSMP